MITAQLTYCAEITDLPGVVEAFSMALNLKPEDALDLLVYAAKTANTVVITVTDAAFGRLVANTNISINGPADGQDLELEILHQEEDEGLTAVHVVTDGDGGDDDDAEVSTLANGDLQHRDVGQETAARAHDQYFYFPWTGAA